MRECEILAPVGGQQQLLAAARCGADAVYLGTQGFNARRNAENFDGDSLSAAVSYCHARDVKVYVTVNTLVMDRELEKLEDEARAIAASGADAVIIQDMAVMALFRDRCPTLRRHASTQTAVHNTDGAKLLRDLGYDRIVLARELTLREMENVISESGIEAEAFVHGAHCMSVSGACYLSAALGGRSGNRGMCAQPCRLDFRIDGKPYALSLKDMSYIGHIRELAGIGVSSFKIEGRMKRPEYVAAAVTACRESLAGRQYDDASLEAVFSRSGFTDGYLRGARDAGMFGYRRKEDVAAAEGVLGPLAALYRAETQRVPVTFALTLAPQCAAELTAHCGEESVTVCGAVPEAAINRPTDSESAYRNLAKTGGTQYRLDGFDFTSAGGLTLPVSELNALRRAALSALGARRASTRAHEFLDRAAPEDTAPYLPPAEPELWGRFENPGQLSGTRALARVILPLREIEKHPELIKTLGEVLTGELPAVAFPEYEQETRACAQRLRELGLGSLLAENIYGVYMGRELGFEVIGGAGLNVFNTPSARIYKDLGVSAVTVSFELAMSAIKRLGGGFRRGFIAYGYLPLMRLRACPGKLSGGCAHCDGAPELTDRKGLRFPMLCFEKRFTTLLNSVPLYIADRELAPVDFMTLCFTTETRAEAEGIIAEYETRASSAKPRTRGLYYRGVL